MYISQNFLSKDDITNLSLVSSLICSSVISQLFSHLTFWGRKWNIGNREPLQGTVIQLHYSRYRVNGLCKEAHLLPYIRNVDVRNWVLMIGNIWRFSFTNRTFIQPQAQAHIIALWESALRDLMDRLVALPWLQQLPFMEVVRYRPLFLNSIYAIRQTAYGVSHANFNVDTVDQDIRSLFSLYKRHWPFEAPYFNVKNDLFKGLVENNGFLLLGITFGESCLRSLGKPSLLKFKNFRYLQLELTWLSKMASSVESVAVFQNIMASCTNVWALKLCRSLPAGTEHQTIFNPDMLPSLDDFIGNAYLAAKLLEDRVEINVAVTDKRVNLCLTSASSWGKQIAYIHRM